MRSWAAFLLAFLFVAIPATQASSALPPIEGQFDLTTLDGRDVTLANYRGKWLLIYFGYTFCPDVCPAVLTEVSQALKELGPKAAHVRVLFITVDPVRDTAAVMKNYLKAFDPRIEGLRGDHDAIEMAAKSFHVYYRVRMVGGGEYAIDHSSYVYVLNPKGQFVDLLPPDVPGHKMAQDIRKLIH